MNQILRKILDLCELRGRRSDLPKHLIRGQIGEEAAARYFRQNGLKILAKNFKSKRGEIDLVLKDGDCVVFAEVKSRNDERWTRPAAAVDREKRQHLSMAAIDYLKAIKNPRVKIRFDIVEVLLNGEEIREIRHLPNTFEMEEPFRYG